MAGKKQATSLLKNEIISIFCEIEELDRSFRCTNSLETRRENTKVTLKKIQSLYKTFKQKISAITNELSSQESELFETYQHTIEMLVQNYEMECTEFKASEESLGIVKWLQEQVEQKHPGKYRIKLFPQSGGGAVLTIYPLYADDIFSHH